MSKKKNIWKILGMDARIDEAVEKKLNESHETEGQ